MLPEYLTKLVDAWQLVGSRVTCNPPPVGTDQDILVYISDPEKYDVFEDELRANKWKIDREYDDSVFVSWKKDMFRDKWNIILTEDLAWYNKFMSATMECKEKNVLDKGERIRVFQKYLPQKEKPELPQCNWLGSKPVNTLKSPIKFSASYAQSLQANLFIPSVAGAVHDAVAIQGGPSEW